MNSSLWLEHEKSLKHVVYVCVDGCGEDLAVSAGVRYYASVRACNALQLCSQATSNGATFDATPPTSGHVLDSYMGGDQQYQASP